MIYSRSRPTRKSKRSNAAPGHDGTYAVKKEFHAISKKIARPVVRKVKQSDAAHFVSDCPMAAEQIAQELENQEPEHPLGLLRLAYGI